MMSNGTTLYRKIGEDLPIVSYGHEHILHQQDGTHLLDFSSGPCCFSLGYSNKPVKDAIAAQMLNIPSAFGGWWATGASERAGESLKREFEKMKPGWFGRVVFQQGGGEAVDFACKIAAQYHLEVSHSSTTPYAATPERVMFGARQFAYHGIGTMSGALSDFYPRYARMEPYQMQARKSVVRLPHPIMAHDGPTTHEIIRRTRVALDRNPTVAAIFIEPVGGPPIAAFPDPSWYIEQLREICYEYGVLLIFDEILCGSGRCGHISVAEHYGVWPDIVLLGKGVSAGYQPVSAIVLSNRVVNGIAAGSGTLMFGTAHGTHSMGCAAVAASIDYITDNDLCARVRNGHDYIMERLEEMVADVPIVTRLSGMGYLFGLALGTPDGHMFQPILEVHALARGMIRDKGVVVYSKGQTMDGGGDFITIAPPFEIPQNAVDEAVDKIHQALTELSTKLGY